MASLRHCAMGRDAEEERRRSAGLWGPLWALAQPGGGGQRDTQVIISLFVELCTSSKRNNNKAQM